MSKYAGWDDVGNKHGLDDGTLKTLYPAGIIMVRIDGEEFSLVSTVGCEEQNPGTIFVG